MKSTTKEPSDIEMTVQPLAVTPAVETVEMEAASFTVATSSRRWDWDKIVGTAFLIAVYGLTVAYYVLRYWHAPGYAY
jgi:hypothetical protein